MSQLITVETDHSIMVRENASKRAQFIWFLFENSLFLVSGAVLALIWANVDEKSYQHFIHFDLGQLFGHSAHSATAAAGHAEHGFRLSVHFLVNDVLMALFFAIAAKEVWESLLPGGALSNVRKAATPLLATAGGVVGPSMLYLVGALALGHQDTLGRGWAVPCATDIAFSYMVARIVFGAGHPAIPFLLLLAIADDAAGLVILAVFYPAGELALPWLGLAIVAMGLCFVFRKLRLHSFWWYLLIPGILCWYAFFMSGIHPALGLVPIIFCMPHAHTDLGIFARDELKRPDTLNEFEHWWSNPVELVLGMFGLVNAGVAFGSIGPGTWLVTAGLLIGKPVGITLFTWLGEKLLGLELPQRMNYRHVVSLGMVAGIGFTVALFMATAAFPSAGPIQDSVKMGALFSFFSAIVAYLGARALGIRPEHVHSIEDDAEQIGSEQATSFHG